MKLTEQAMSQVKKVMADNGMTPESVYLRVGIQGRSCSGPVYSFGFDEMRDLEGDELVEQDGVAILYDKDFTPFLAGVEIDYKEVEDRKGFVFENKNPPPSTLEILGGGCSSGGGCCGGGCSA